MPAYTHTLLATLGGQPQVVTFTLDLLLSRGVPIKDVIVIHPTVLQPRLKHSLACLNTEFMGDRYQVNGQIIHFHSHILRLDEEPLEDIVDDMSANGALDTIHSLIRTLKQQHRHMHLSVTGGRRLMSLLAISAALLNFDHADHLWHIYTPDAIRQQAKEGALMHVPSEAGVSLIEMPFVPWGTYFSNLPQPVDSSAQAVLRSQTANVDMQTYECCKQVKQVLTNAPLKVLRAFAKGMNPQEVAEVLYLSPSTVSTHTTRIFEACREAWDMPEKRSLSYHFLRDKFARYFEFDE